MTNPNLIIERILPNAYMALGYYLWISDYKQVVKENALSGKFSTDFEVKVEIGYLELGLLEGSLVAFRKFHDFFEKKKEGKPDDLYVSDFFPDYKVGGYLTTDERIEINKTIAHLTTYKAVSGNLKTDVLDMTRRFMKKFLEFCEFIMDADEETIPAEVSETAQKFRQVLINYLYTLRDVKKGVQRYGQV